MRTTHPSCSPRALLLLRQVVRRLGTCTWRVLSSGRELRNTSYAVERPCSVRNLAGSSGKFLTVRGRSPPAPRSRQSELKATSLLIADLRGCGNQTLLNKICLSHTPASNLWYFWSGIIFASTFWPPWKSRASHHGSHLALRPQSW